MSAPAPGALERMIAVWARVEGDSLHQDDFCTNSNTTDSCMKHTDHSRISTDDSSQQQRCTSTSHAACCHCRASASKQSRCVVRAAQCSAVVQCKAGLCCALCALRGWAIHCCAALPRAHQRAGVARPLQHCAAACHACDAAAARHNPAACLLRSAVRGAAWQWQGTAASPIVQVYL